jgi:hypothetical protein
MSDELDKALALLKEIAAHGERWGKHGTIKDFSQIDVMDALIAASKAGCFDGSATQLKADLTLARRQLAAANARLAKYAKAEQVETTDGQ